MKFVTESVKAEQIGDIFEEILISVAKTAALHKKEIFKKILFKQFQSNEIETDETSRFINITNQLTKVQYQILSTFNRLSDNVIKYKIQILELKAEQKNLKEKRIVLQEKYNGDGQSVKKILEREKHILKLISSKKNALLKGKINPNSHKTFNVNREDYIVEIQDLLSKGLLFDFANNTKEIESNMHFGITKLGRRYIWYIEL